MFKEAADQKLKKWVSEYFSVHPNLSNEELREELALRYIDFKALEEVFRMGSEWREETASVGFSEWENNWYSKGNTYRPKLETVWQAAQLSSAKLLDEKDKELSQAKKLIRSMQEALKYYDKYCPEFEPQGCCNGVDCSCLGKPVNPEWYLNELASGVLRINSERIKSLLGEE